MDVISLPSIGFYAVNLDRARYRWEAIERNFGDLPWPLERVRALDCEIDVEKILARRGQTLAYPPDGLGWNPLHTYMFSLVEEATFCSHLAALERFLESGQAYAVVVEDDAQPRREVAAELQSIINSDVAFDVVKLEGIRHRGARLAVEEVRLGEVALVRSLRPSSGAAGYLVTRHSAKKLLDNAGQRLVPYDDYLNNTALNRCSILHLSPYLIWQSGTDSTMHDARKRAKSIRRGDPYHRLTQALGRLRLRFLLWYDALLGPYQAPVRLKKAPW